MHEPFGSLSLSKFQERGLNGDLRLPRWVSTARALRVAACGVWVFLIGHAVVIALVGAPAALQIGEHIAFGSNGLAIRAHWDRIGRASLDMTVLGDSFRIDCSPEELYLQVPVVLASLILFVLFVSLHLVLRLATRAARTSAG